MQKKIKTDLKKYSEDSYKSWINTQPVFTKKSLLIKNYQVMQRWEDSYMKSLAAIVTSCGGDVLEIGFGLGISAGYIEKSKKIHSHTIIECHPAVLASAKQMFKYELKSGRMKLHEGLWEEITPRLPNESFNGILFDSCPLDSGVEFFQFFPFFKEAYRLLKDDGIFTYFSDEVRGISKKHREKLTQAGFQNINFKICKVHPPKSCEYWKYDTIISPIVKKYSQ